MRTILILTCLMSALVTVSAQQKHFYDFTVKTISGENFPLSSLRGKKVLIVNVASKCGFTPQYAQLQELYDKYGPDRLVILGFPANNFARQEPGSNEDILQFCRLNYGVTFRMMEKISVAGKDIHPLYAWLTQKSKNGKKNAKVRWNFQKFMIDEAGNWVGYAAPGTSPLAREITDWIENTPK
jgi:glutathione peroxidase